MTAAERIDQPAGRAPLASNAELLDSLSALAASVASLDAASCEESAATLPATVHQIRSAVERGAELLLALDHAHEPPAAGGEPEAVDLPLTPSAAQGLKDMCFAGTLELNRALRELSLARGEADMLVAAETACRKLRRALQAVITAASYDGLGGNAGGEQQRRREATDLRSALAVRKLYARFRRSLRRPSDDAPAAVLTALRYAAGALATLIGSPEYASARLSDRALLRCLRDRVLGWARGEQSEREGSQLLGDIGTCADLLRGVNGRQELRAHDTLLRSSLLADRSDDGSAWLRSCEALYGLDDELDELLEPEHPTEAIEDRVAAVLVRLKQL